METRRPTQSSRATDQKELHTKYDSTFRGNIANPELDYLATPEPTNTSQLANNNKINSFSTVLAKIDFF